MDASLSIDAIRIRQRRVGASGGSPEMSAALSQKLDELFEHGFERDDVFAVVVPLLMQGKVRLDIGDDSQRLELEDPELRQTRPDAIRLFEQYLAAGRSGLATA